MERLQKSLLKNIIPSHQLPIEIPFVVYLCSFAYYNDLQEVGIKLYRYRSGFMHQKVILVDRDIAGVGTVNLDNRSFFLNFEVMTFSIDSQFIQSVATMLQDDLNVSRAIDLDTYQKKPFLFKLAAKVSRLLAPILRSRLPNSINI